MFLRQKVRQKIDKWMRKVTNYTFTSQKLQVTSQKLQVTNGAQQ